MQATRRDVVKSSGAAVMAPPAFLGLGSHPPPRDRYDVPPTGDVTLEYDEAFLKKHRPAFVASPTTRSQYRGLYGYKASAEAYDYDVACYWSQLTHQDDETLWGVSTPAVHLGDHEPVYVFVSPETGASEHVVPTVYHHIAIKNDDAENFQFVAHETSEATHPVLRIVDGYHHYNPIESDAWAIENYELKDWTAVEQTWADHDFYKKMYDAAVRNPAVMLERPAWWDDGTLDYFAARQWYRLGRGGADQTEDIRT